MKTVRTARRDEEDRRGVEAFNDNRLERGRSASMVHAA
jgi:hypothetical protein